jgi:dihydropyrimidinase
MGLYPKKGIIGIGSDADLTIIDPRERWIVDHEDLHMGVDWNCWDGWELDGKVTHTILRGQVLVENGNLSGSPSSGQFIERKLLPEFTGFP